MFKYDAIEICVTQDEITICRKAWQQPGREHTYRPGPDSEARLEAFLKHWGCFFERCELRSASGTRTWYWYNQDAPDDVQDAIDYGEPDYGVSHRDFLSPRHFGR